MEEGTKAVNEHKAAEAEHFYLEALRQANAFGEQDPRLTATLRELADLYMLKRDLLKAEPLYNRELRILEGMGQNYPNVAHDLLFLGKIYFAKGDYARSDAFSRRALAIDDKFLVLNAAEKCILFSLLAQNSRKLHNFEDAEAFYDKELAAKHLVNPEDPELASELLSVAENYKDENKHQQSELCYRKVAELWEKKFGSGYPELAKIYAQLSHLYINQGRLAEAKEFSRRMGTVIDSYKGKPRADFPLLSRELASDFASVKEYAAAETLYKQALALQERGVPLSAPESALTYVKLANLYRACDRLAEAVATYKQALKVYGRSSASPSLDVVNCHCWLGQTYLEQKKAKEAEATFRQALSIAETKRNSSAVIGSLGCLSGVLMHQRKFPAAETMAKRALALSQKNPDPESSATTARCLVTLAVVYYAQQEYDRALPLFERALAIYTQPGRLPSCDSSGLIDLYIYLNKIHCAKGQYLQAIDFCKQALDLLNKSPDHRELRLNLLAEYEYTLRKAQQNAEADKIQMQSRALRKSTN
jgi:tetratricopeptide (TPR) repeat protein